MTGRDLATTPLPAAPHAALAAGALAVARRFAAGATMWCWSPAWPHHAHHVAVEFVHPVIVGTRALPAVAVDATDAVPALRALVSSGDLLLVISAASDRLVRDAMRRATAWGVTTVWLGVGPRPPDGAADHVVWTEEASPDGVYGGELMVLYHVLWELTHVCFEHPGLLNEARQSAEESCVTCADEGRLAEVVIAASDTAVVRTPAGREEIDSTLVEPLAAGDLVVVHAGAAIQRVEP